MLVAAFRLLRDSGRVLLEIAPSGMNVTEVGNALAAHAHVTEVHDLHLWEISSGFPALSAHVHGRARRRLSRDSRRARAHCSSRASASTTRRSRSTTSVGRGSCSSSGARLSIGSAAHDPAHRDVATLLTPSSSLAGVASSRAAVITPFVLLRDAFISAALTLASSYELLTRSLPPVQPKIRTTSEHGVAQR